MTSPMRTGHWPRSPRSRSRIDHVPACSSSSGTSATTAAVAPGTVSDRSSWSPGVSMLILSLFPKSWKLLSVNRRVGRRRRAELRAGDGPHDLFRRRRSNVVRTYPLAKSQDYDPVDDLEDIGQVVGDHHHRQPIGTQAANKLKHLASLGDAQCRGG